MCARPTTPYGAWPSPISAADVVAGGRRFRGAQFVDGDVWWTEGRPEEQGRQAVVRQDAEGRVHDVIPPPWNARSRVHEYGGTSWLTVTFEGATALVFANFADQRLYRVSPGGTPVAITPEPDEPAALRYADPVLGPGGDEVWWVREAHHEGTVVRHLVGVRVDGAGVRELVGGSDFLAYPRPSPDGRRLAWVAWDHPRMPWDGTELRVADIGSDGAVGPARTVLGGERESVLQPEWTVDGDLHLISDRSGWWNLYRLDLESGDLRALCPREEEFAGPLWSLGSAWYAALDDGRLAVLHGTDAEGLGLLDPESGDLRELDLPYTSYDGLSIQGTSLLTVAASPTHAPGILLVDLVSGEHRHVLVAVDRMPDLAYLPHPEAMTVAGTAGRDVHAWVYPPANPDVEAPADELPPYIVVVHGGPTGQSHATLSLDVAYFTSRGFGIVDVNYGGSTGYGREYRERLRGQWGVVDVEDAASSARALADQGLADGPRLAIRGGSAGGWTTLAALTRSRVFSAGVSYFGVAELERFVETTHDFESRYIDGLVGPLPEALDLYRQRAPLNNVDALSCPVLLLQGSEDRVVPPSQSEMFRDALVRKGIPHAYLLFEGEQHGFRRRETKIAALEAELSFYGQVFGFDPPGVPRLQLEGAPGG
ncbi:MAG TPA: S9 family peptidase [Candidatus Dormibacteraeota bacterium]|nr:S9 family peptidase [Candidatus Dormibacteraeota bacterium]